jgi:hypothetical protein
VDKNNAIANVALTSNAKYTDSLGWRKSAVTAIAGFSAAVRSGTLCPAHIVSLNYLCRPVNGTQHG